MPTKEIPELIKNDVDLIIKQAASATDLPLHSNAVKRYTRWAFEYSGLSDDRYPGLYQGIENGQMEVIGEDTDDNGFTSGSLVTQLGQLAENANATSAGLLSIIGGFTSANLVLMVHNQDNTMVLASGTNSAYGEHAFLGIQTDTGSAKAFADGCTAILTGTYQKTAGGPVTILQPRTLTQNQGVNTAADPGVKEPVQKGTHTSDANIRIGLGRGPANRKKSDVDYWFWQNTGDLSYAVPLVGAVKFTADIATLDPGNNFFLNISLTKKAGGTKTLSGSDLTSIYENFGIYADDNSILTFNEPSGDNTEANYTFDIPTTPTATSITLPTRMNGSTPVVAPVNFGMLNWATDSIAYFSCTITVSLSGQLLPGVTGIYSSDTEDNNQQNGILYIKPFKYYFHCLAEGTLIRLDDDNLVNIEDLTHKHRVKIDNNNALSVQANIVGHHRGSAYWLKTASGKQLTLSFNHPVMTESGPVRAMDLCPGDSILVREGSDTVAEIKTIDFDGFLWNIALGEDDEKERCRGRTTMFANDILVGDQQLMENLQESRNKDPESVRQIIDPMYHTDYASLLTDRKAPPTKN